MIKSIFKHNPVKYLQIAGLIVGGLFLSMVFIDNPSLLNEGLFYKDKFTYYSFITLWILLTAGFSYTNITRNIFLFFIIIFYILTIVGSTGLGPLFTLLIFLYSSYILGSILLKGLNWSFKIIIGTSIYIAILNFLVLFKFNNRFVYSLLLLVPLSYGIYISTFENKIKLYFLKRIEIQNYFQLSLLAMVLFPTLLSALGPEFGFDALSYQLVPSYFIKFNGFWHFDITKNTLAVMPFGINWIYGLVLMLSNQYAVNLANFSFFLIAINIIYFSLSRWTSPKYALASIILLTSIPLVDHVTCQIFIENGLLIFSLGSLFLLIEAYESKNNNYFILSVWLFFTCLSIKHTGIIYFLSFLPFIIWIFLKLKVSFNRMVVVCTLGTIFFIFLVYGVAFIKTGNPVFPFFNGFFKSPYFSSLESFSNHLFKLPLSYNLIFDMTLNSYKYLETGGVVIGFSLLFFSPYYLAYLLNYKAIANTEKIILVGTLIFFITVFKFQAYLRYLYPAIILLNILILISLYNSRNNILTEKVIFFLIFILVSMNVYQRPKSTYGHHFFSFPAVFNSDFSREMNTQVAPINLIYDYLNEKYDRNYVIINLLGPQSAFAKGTVYSLSWHHFVFQNKLNSALMNDGADKFLIDYGVTHILVNNQATSLQTFSKICLNLCLKELELEVKDLKLYKLLSVEKK